MKTISHAQVERQLLALPFNHPFVLFRFGVERLGKREWRVEDSPLLSLCQAIDRLMAQYQPVEEPC